MNVALHSKLLALGLVIGGCAAPSARPEHWGYNGEIGPEKWGALSPAYAVCSNGTMQSPIDIPLFGMARPFGFELDYKSSALDISHHEHVDDLIDNGHTIQVDVNGNHTLTIGGVAYILRQFHFHTPSEHKVSGAAYPMEMHLVHQSADGRFAVLGVLFALQENVATIYDRMILHLPEKRGERVVVDSVYLDINLLLPNTRNFYLYTGSFTTPPCTENVKWVILSEPMKVSPDVINALSKRLAPNNRPAQPLNGRSASMHIME